MALISDELYKSLEKNCGGEYYENIDPNNSEFLKEFEKEFGPNRFWKPTAVLLPENHNKKALAEEDRSTRILKNFLVLNHHFRGSVALEVKGNGNDATIASLTNISFVAVLSIMQTLVLKATGRQSTAEIMTC